MKIEVECIKENDDGSADVIVRTDEEGTKFLVERGLMAIFMEAITQNGTDKNNEP